jgi:thiamine-monophosphate kinase
VSDGLYADLQKLLSASKVGGALDLALLPLSAAILAKFNRDKAIDLALSGGDDYELCFTASRSVDAEIHALAKQNRVLVTRLGEVVSGDSIICTRDGEQFEYADSGYRHF